MVLIALCFFYVGIGFNVPYKNINLKKSIFFHVFENEEISHDYDTVNSLLNAPFPKITFEGENSASNVWYLVFISMLFYICFIIGQL